MTLLIVTPWPLDSCGGGQRLAAAVARSLAIDHGVEVVVAAGSGLLSNPPGPMPAERFREVRLPLVSDRGTGTWDRGTEVPRYKSLLGVARDFSPATVYLDGLEALAEEVNPDAVLYTPHFSSCAQQAAAIAERRQVPFLLWPAMHVDHARHTSRAARRLYRSAAFVLCLSDVEREWLVRRAGVSPQHVLTLGYGWNGDATRRARAVTPTRPVRLLTVGAFTRHKQLDHQLDALALLRGALRVDARLTIAGALREPSVLERLLTLTRRRELEASVDFVTDCTDTTIAELHAVADVFLFTSASESFGVALLEAIGFGTFPIAYPHPVYRGLIESSRFGALAERSTPNALAAAVGRALDARLTVSDQHRLRWLATRSWARITAPLAQALSGGTADTHGEPDRGDHGEAEDVLRIRRRAVRVS